MLYGTHNFQSKKVSKTLVLNLLALTWMWSVAVSGYAPLTSFQVVWWKSSKLLLWMVLETSARISIKIWGIEITLHVKVTRRTSRYLRTTVGTVCQVYHSKETGSAMNLLAVRWSSAWDTKTLIWHDATRPPKNIIPTRPERRMQKVYSTRTRIFFTNPIRR